MLGIMKFKIITNFIKNPQIYKFLTVSIILNIFHLLFIIFLTSTLGIFYAHSVLISLEIFTIASFFFNDVWTFSNIQKSSKKITRLIKFNLFASIGFALNESILIFLTSQFGIDYFYSEVVAVIIVFFFNFIISKKITWRN